MNTNSNNNFDTLLTLALKDYAARSAEEFLSIDTGGGEVTPAMRRRFKRILREAEKKKKPRLSAWRIFVAACIICLSICITACVAIPEIRNYIKKAFVEWCNGYVAIEFVEQTEAANDGQADISAPDTQADSQTDLATESAEITTDGNTAATDTETEDGTKSSHAETVKPTSIVKKAYATYLPGDYRCEVEGDSNAQYLLSYYDENELTITLLQSIISKNHWWSDSENRQFKIVSINGFEGIISQDEYDSSVYSLVWQDNEYEYYIDGYFANEDEILKVAEGIRLQ